MLKNKTTVSIQPKEVSKVLSESELYQLVAIIDKLLGSGIQLNINYGFSPK